MAIDLPRVRECADQLRDLMPQRVLDADLHAITDLVAFVDDLLHNGASFDGAHAALDAMRPAEPVPEPVAPPDVHEVPHAHSVPDSH